MVPRRKASWWFRWWSGGETSPRCTHDLRHWDGVSTPGPRQIDESAAGLARWVYLTTLNVLNRSLRADLFVARFPLLGVLFLACSSHQKVDGLPPHSLT